MPRRSTRVTKSANVEVPDVSSGDDHEPFVEPSEDEQDEGPTEKKKTKGKKRKNTTRSTAGQPPAKKPRGKRGILSELLEMPYDIVYEIFSQLNPNDLLSLMRTNKDLRAFFRNRESASLWKATRHHFPGLPECPEDLSEPQYAELAFGKICSVCSRKVVVLHTCWSARVKVCNKCLPDTFSQYINYDIPSALKDYVPSMSAPKPGGRHRYDRMYYYSPTMNRFTALSRQNNGSENTRKLIDDEAKAQKAIFTHARACAVWDKKYQAELEKDKESMIDHRKAIILDHLREAGWDDEIERMDQEDLLCLRTETEMVKVCQKPLTDKSTTNLIQHLDEYLTNSKAKRIRKARKAFLQKRIPILRQSVEDYVLTIPVNEAREFPGVPDLFCHPVVRDFIDNTPTEDWERDRLNPLLPMFPEIVRGVQSTIRDKAIALVAKGCGEENDYNPDTVLDLATTIFSCSQCRTKGPNNRSELYASQTLRFPDIMHHPCAVFNAYKLQGYVQEDEVDFEVLSERAMKANWNRYNQISFKPENQKALAEAVFISGFDPKVATSAEMDAADPIFECVACNDLHKGRATMRWSLVAAHYQECHVKLPASSYSIPKEVVEMKLELLNDEDAQIARKRMDEDIARERASESQHLYTSNSMTCAHCIYPTVDCANSVKVKEHVRTVHNILRPTDDDIVPIPSKRFIQSVFYMWPPREVWGVL